MKELTAIFRREAHRWDSYEIRSDRMDVPNAEERETTAPICEPKRSEDAAGEKPRLGPWDNPGVQESARTILQMYIGGRTIGALYGSELAAIAEQIWREVEFGDSSSERRGNGTQAGPGP